MYIKVFLTERWAQRSSLECYFDSHKRAELSHSELFLDAAEKTGPAVPSHGLLCKHSDLAGVRFT